MSKEPLFDAVKLAQELVRIPSVNPMGRDFTESPYLEGRLTDFLSTQFSRLELPSERYEVLPGRENVITRVDSANAELTILLEVHQDTVPIDGMTIDPFGGKLENGRLYGRGACDIKGGMAAMLSSVARLARERPPGAANVVFACTINEENGFDGARHLRHLWETGHSPLLPKAPDLIIVAEPTGLNVVTAHKGTVRWRCQTRGKAAHSSMPDKGKNAIYSMARLLAHLEVYAREVVPELDSHPLVGQPSLSVGMIEGGLSVTTVPDICTVEIDRRLLPEEQTDSALQHVTDFLETQMADTDFSHETPFLAAPGLSDRLNGDLARSLLRVIRTCGHAAECLGVPYGTDASTLAGADLPAVVFGPGDIAQAHTKDEWVEAVQLEQAAEILYQFCRSTNG